jgi:hypothetical protein
VPLYFAESGRRITIVAGNQWYTLRLEYSGKRIDVILDGKQPRSTIFREAASMVEPFSAPARH